ncbi:GNAT family N-acetyltransferase [Thomasclavelia ramosa]|uniref:GNAT family N-acetyltransferase n=1 Tax=Thomasclavelia ramosa TaxID=1547 RepID=UPI0030030EA7
MHSLLKCELGYDVSCEKLVNRIENMCKDENYCIYVAVEDKQVVGFIGLHFGLAFEISGKLMRIIALAVSYKYQKNIMCL